LLAIHSTFEVISDLLNRILGVSICPSTIKEVSEKIGEKNFKSRLKLWLYKTKACWSKQIVLVSDGAVWISNIAKELFPNAIHILDWFHTTEALWKCAKKTFGQNSKKVLPWVEKYKELIWEGGIEKALEFISAEAKISKKPTALLDLYKYFNTRVGQMQYQNFRLQGLYIGSGAIESANKYAIQDRLKKVRTRVAHRLKWSIQGANAIAHLRTKYLSKKWCNHWVPT